MKYVANIITESKRVGNSFLNVRRDISDVDLTLPTLIVGWKTVRELFPEQNILEKTIKEPNVFWTFSEREKRSEFESDSKKFYDFVKKDVEGKINYRFFNYILSDDCKKESFYKFMDEGGKYIYVNNRFIYVYDGSSTIGVSLEDIEYIGMSKKEFINEINRKQNNIMLNSSFFDEYDVEGIIGSNIKAAPMLKYLTEQ